GSVVSNGLVELVGVFRLCKLWGIWFRIGLGYVLIALLFYRAYSLDRIFNQRKRCSGWSYYWPGVVLFAIGLIFCTASQLVSDQKTLVYLDTIEVCHFVGAFRYIGVSMIWTILIVYAIQIVKIRNIKSSFNEFLENLVIFFIIFAVILQLTILVVFISKDPYNTAIRIVTTCFDLAGGNLVIWCIIMHPIYMCMFKRDEYEKQWLRKLAGDGLTKEYEVHERVPLSSLSYSRMNDGTLENPAAVQLKRWREEPGDVSITASVDNLGDGSHGLHGVPGEPPHTIFSSGDNRPHSPRVLV
ncbi:hypothetical protein GQ54DRAFT_176973, partial [Martensiomyces pterosporus]